MPTDNRFDMEKQSSGEPAVKMPAGLISIYVVVFRIFASRKAAMFSCFVTPRKPRICFVWGQLRGRRRSAQGIETAPVWAVLGRYGAGPTERGSCGGMETGIQETMREAAAFVAAGRVFRPIKLSFNRYNEEFGESIFQGEGACAGAGRGLRSPKSNCSRWPGTADRPEPKSAQRRALVLKSLNEIRF